MCIYVCMKLCIARKRSVLLMFVRVLYAQVRFILFLVVGKYGDINTGLRVIKYVYIAKTNTSSTTYLTVSQFSAAIYVFRRLRSSGMQRSILLGMLEL